MSTAETMPPEDPTFFNKLGEIPVVNDGWTAAWEYYSKVKDYNALTRLSLAMAETSVKVAGKVSTPVLSPVISRYQPQIDNVNDYACKKLDELEDKYPLMMQPTSEVKEACAEYIEPVVKPVVTQVQGMIDNSKKQVARIKTCGTNVVVGAKDFGVGTVTNVVQATFETTPGRFVTRTIDGVLDHADVIVDKYLPSGDDEKSEDAEKDGQMSEEDSDDETKSKCAVEPMEKDNPTPERVAIHLRCVSEKIRRRMYRLAVRDFRKAKSDTTNALSKLSNTVELVDFAKKNLNSARDKVEEMWSKMVKESEQTEKEKASLFAGTIEERIIALGAMVTGQVKSGVTLLEKTSSELGSFTKHPITKTKEYSEVVKSFSIVRSMQDFSTERLQQLTSSLSFLQKKCRDLLEGIDSPEWLKVDIDMKEIDLQDNDLSIEQVVASNNNSEDEVEREGERDQTLNDSSSSRMDEDLD